MSQTLVIEREKWLRGEKQGRLLRGSDGKMCCLGFYGLACGLTQDHIRNEGLPADARPALWPGWLVRKRGPDLGEPEGWEDTSECERLASVNDGPGIEGAVRESQIAAIFAKHGVLVVFK